VRLQQGLLDHVGGFQVAPKRIAQLKPRQQEEVFPKAFQGRRVGFGSVIHFDPLRH
jgi:hypothetical protein